MIAPFCSLSPWERAGVRARSGKKVNVTKPHAPTLTLPQRGRENNKEH
jgi:hypothetical protein